MTAQRAKSMNQREDLAARSNSHWGFWWSKMKCIHTKKKGILLLAGLIVFSSGSFGQSVQNESLVVRKHSPTRASLYSAVLPGLGQVYNKKYWKVPIIYAGFGIMVYITSENRSEYKQFKEAYNYTVNGDITQIDNSYVGRYNEQQLLRGMNYYRRNMEVGYIIIAAWYLLNIVDASVDAHLFYYDISENLSMKLEPTMINDPSLGKQVAGLSLSLKF